MKRLYKGLVVALDREIEENLKTIEGLGFSERADEIRREMGR